MRVMVLIKANADSEAGVMPSDQLITEMGEFNEMLEKDGILLAAEGLYPSSNGKRVRFSNGKFNVIDGPFTETKELIAGYWVWRVKSIEQAVELVRRIPNPDNSEFEIEIRPIGDMENLPDSQQ